MVLDSSVIIAILLAESDAEIYSQSIIDKATTSALASSLITSSSKLNLSSLPKCSSLLERGKDLSFSH